MKVYNTLSGKKEEFQPQGDEVTMYVCGINPYADCHIGHAMSYIVFDVVHRYLNFRGYKVRHVQNITDIEDNIIARANKLGIPVRELTDKYTDRYFEDMDALNVTRADVYPKATEEIPKIIEIVQGLIEKGYAYVVGDSVYFRVRKVADYGKLSHRSLESMKAGARIEPGEEKEDPMDFVLWKGAKPGEPSWDSPWGKGRPGWHIECSAMSLRYLGDTLDIHGGGHDLIFPHHENEIVQSECFTGKKPFVKYWLHNGLVQLGEEKMSKSLGNLITIREALEKYSADAIRVFALSSHYRSPLTYSEEAVDAAERGVWRLLRAVAGRVPRPFGEKMVSNTYRERFIEAMDDDFGTAQALAVLFDLARDINRADEAGMDVSEAQRTLSELGSDVLGLTFAVREEKTLEADLHRISISLKEYAGTNIKEALTPIQARLPQLEVNESIFTNLSKSLQEQFEDAFPGLANKFDSTGLYSEALNSLRKNLAQSDFTGVIGSLSQLSSAATTNIDSLSDFREQLRKEKKWSQADMIRGKLEDIDIFIEDTPHGPVWRRKR